MEYEKPTLSSREKLEIKVLKFIKENNIETINQNSLKSICDNKYHLELIEDLQIKDYISHGTIAKMVGGNFFVPNVHITLDGEDYLKENI